MIDLLLIAPLGCDNHARTALSGPRCPGRVFFYDQIERIKLQGNKFKANSHQGGNYKQLLGRFVLAFLEFS
jgi:hypothetical protein